MHKTGNGLNFQEEKQFWQLNDLVISSVDVTLNCSKYKLIHSNTYCYVFSINTTVENSDGSTYELKLQYTPLPQVDLEKQPDIQTSDNSKFLLYYLIRTTN